MPRVNIYAYTETYSVNYPGYVSLNEVDGVPELTVRSPGDGGRNVVSLNVPDVELRRLADAIYARLGKP